MSIAGFSAESHAVGVVMNLEECVMIPAAPAVYSGERDRIERWLSTQVSTDIRACGMKGMCPWLNRVG